MNRTGTVTVTAGARRHVDSEKNSFLVVKMNKLVLIHSKFKAKGN